MRINKYLADQGYTTRRGADELITRRKVLINGRVAVLGDKVAEGDVVEVKDTGKQKEYKYFAYYKPKGETTHSPLKGTFYVGRLDKDSHGLIILTNDGRVTDRLLNPDKEHSKEYLVTTVQNLRPSFKKNMEQGVDIGDYVTKKCRVEVIGPRTFKIILTEGKKHQIRRMCATLHLDVADLKRIKVMNISLGNLKPKLSRPLTEQEQELFLKKLGL